MRTKEEILESYQALAQEVVELNESATDEKEKFHMFFIGGHIRKGNVVENITGRSQLFGEEHILGKLLADDDATKHFIKIAIANYISNLLENSEESQ